MNTNHGLTYVTLRFGAFVTKAVRLRNDLFRRGDSLALRAKDRWSIEKRYRVHILYYIFLFLLLWTCWRKAFKRLRVTFDFGCLRVVSTLHCAPRAKPSGKPFSIGSDYENCPDDTGTDQVRYYVSCGRPRVLIKGLTIYLSRIGAANGGWSHLELRSTLPKLGHRLGQPHAEGTQPHDP